MSIPTTFDAWRKNADRELKDRYCITLEDAGLDDDYLEKFFADGERPDAFVAWFAEKYDLTEFTGSAFRG